MKILHGKDSEIKNSVTLSVFHKNQTEIKLFLFVILMQRPHYNYLLSKTPQSEKSAILPASSAIGGN